MDLEDHRRAIWRRRWQVLGASLLIALLVFLRSSSIEDVYAAEAALLAVPAQGGSDAQGEQATFLASTYAELLGSDEVVQRAAELAGLGLDAEEVDERLSGSPSSTPGFLTVSATGPSAEDAEALAQAGADALIEVVSASEADAREVELQPVLEELAALEVALRETDEGSVQRDVLQARYQAAVARQSALEAGDIDAVRLVDDATAGDAPVTPTPRRDALLALVVALIVNAELAVVLEAVSGRFSGRDAEVTRITGLPVLSRIPHADQSETLEALRLLRTNLLYLDVADHVRSLGIIGVGEGVGTSYVAAGLAGVTANLELHVVLIDGDHRSPAIGHMFGIRDEPGLGDLRPGADPAPLLREAPGHPCLQILPAGKHSDDPAGALSGRFREGFRDVIDHIEADLIVVDTTPGAMFADTTAIAAQCDICIVVIDRQLTRRRVAAELIESLRWVGAKPVGVVLNREAAAHAPRRRATSQ